MSTLPSFEFMKYRDCPFCNVELYLMKYKACLTAFCKNKECSPINTSYCSSYINQILIAEEFAAPKSYVKIDHKNKNTLIFERNGVLLFNRIYFDHIINFNLNDKESFNNQMQKILLFS